MRMVWRAASDRFSLHRLPAASDRWSVPATDFAERLLKMSRSFCKGRGCHQIPSRVPAREVRDESATGEASTWKAIGPPCSITIAAA
jgi:hypothetical protein